MTAHDVRLSWTIPVTRMNGDVLRPQEITHYEVTYVLLESREKALVTVNFGTSDTTVISGLVPGAYEFSVVAVDVAGERSRPAYQLFSI